MDVLKRLWNVKDVRNSILFILIMLFIFRVAAHIPIPGVDAEGLKQLFRSNQVLGMINLFSGGGMEKFSVVALGVAPYITASIIIQLLTMIIPQLEDLSKEGEAGQRKINQYTRYLSVPLATLQAIGLIALLSSSSQQILNNITITQKAVMILTMVTGTMFLMWIGELISEKKIGNGISILIFAGIISALPSSLQQFAVTYDPAQIMNIAIFLAMALLTVVSVVIITDGQRKIPVSYARTLRGSRQYGGIDNYLPLRVNQAGVIPIIFAISIVLFPPVIAQFFLSAQSQILVNGAQFIISLFQNQLFYGMLYFGLVFSLTYFYTSIIFKPDQIAENLQKQGGFIPGIRPGNATMNHLHYVMNRIILAGALFLSAIAVLPLVMQGFSNNPLLVVGGTSLLIVVSVAIEIVNQVSAQLTMRDYDAI